jgi:hypothetical protein
MEEYLTVLGEPAALNTAWRVKETMQVRDALLVGRCGIYKS